MCELWEIPLTLLGIAVFWYVAFKAGEWSVRAPLANITLTGLFGRRK